MIWLASFPRSGNTFFRIILHEVYGLESRAFHMEPNRAVDPDYDKYPFVKTHLLPHQLVPRNPRIPAVYLVRDGRDALVSIAHHRSDLIAPGSDFEQNLEEAIIAGGKSFFGGWSRNVLEWLDRASIVIKFEDLIVKPIECVERLRAIVDLPKPDVDKLPTFNDLRSYELPWGRGVKRRLSPKEKRRWAEKFFRRGRVGAWRDEMPYDLHELFWELHGHAMRRLGYEKGLKLDIRPDRLSSHGIRRVSKSLRRTPKLQHGTANRNKVLVDASIIMMGNNDGCERYAMELLRGLLRVAKKERSEWQFDVHLGMKCIFDILDIEEIIMAGLGDNRVYHVLAPGISKRLRRLKVKYFLGKLAIEILPLSAVRFLRSVNRKRFGITDRGHKVPGSKYDLTHLTLPHTYSPLAHYNCRFIATVHDLSHVHYPQFHVKENVAFAKEGLDFVVQSESSFITVSESTKKDLLSEYKELDQGSVLTVYEGVDHERFCPITDETELRLVRDKYNIPPRPYVLSLSTLEPRKNVRNAMIAFLHLVKDMPELDTMFVIAGKKGWKCDDLFNDPALTSDRIVFTGYIDERDLAAIYSGALALSYVSYYEGFGLPPVEAMACGTPVIYGDNSSMPEVIGDGGLPTDPADIEDIREKLKIVICDEERRNAMSQRALGNAKRFSWYKTVESTLDAYRRAIVS